MTEQKVCTGCERSLSTTEFCVRRSAKDGLSPRCRRCGSAATLSWQKANPSKSAAKSARFRRENADLTKTRKKAFYAANRQRLIEDGKEYKRAKAVELAEKRRVRYIEKRDHIRSISKKFRDRHRARLAPQNAARQRLRDARKLQATPKWARTDRMEAFYELVPLIDAETGIKHHVDHIVPLISSIVCGLHCEANLRVLSAAENISKSNRYWPDMP